MAGIKVELDSLLYSALVVVAGRWLEDFTFPLRVGELQLLIQIPANGKNDLKPLILTVAKSKLTIFCEILKVKAYLKERC